MSIPEPYSGGLHRVWDYYRARECGKNLGIIKNSGYITLFGLSESGDLYELGEIEREALARKGVRWGARVVLHILITHATMIENPEYN